MDILDYIFIGEYEGYVLSDASSVGLPDKYVYVPIENSRIVKDIIIRNNPSKRNYIETVFGSGSQEQVSSLISAEIMRLTSFGGSVAEVVAEHSKHVTEMTNEEYEEYQEVNSTDDSDGYTEFADPTFYEDIEQTEGYQVEDYNDGAIFGNSEESSLSSEEIENYNREIEALTEANSKLEEEKTLLTNQLQTAQSSLVEMTSNNQTLREAIGRKVKELEECEVKIQRVDILEKQLKEKCLELENVKDDISKSEDSNQKIEELEKDMEKLNSDKYYINQELISSINANKELESKLLEKEKELLAVKSNIADYAEKLKDRKKDVLGVDIIREIYRTMHELEADTVKKLLLGAILDLSNSDIEEKDEHLTIICRYFYDQGVKKGVISNGN